MADIYTSINTAISLVKRLREVSANVQEAEFRSLLADLTTELADSKLEASALKEELAALQEENRQLKSVKVADDVQPTGTKWGCYQFENDDGLYCTACWDSKRQKSRTTRATSKYRLCPVCNAVHGS